MSDTPKYLLEYRDLIRRGEILVGMEMLTELDRLIADLDNPEYRIDTTKAHTMIDFMQNCIRLTKAPFYNKPMVLMPWQKAWIETLYSFKIYDKDMGKWIDRFIETLLLIGRKNTKALALDTRIPTPSGDKTIADIHTGDYVFDENGEAVKVIGESEIFRNRTCYKITFEDGEEIIADENHKWTVQTKNTRRLDSYEPITSRKRTSYNGIDEHACKVMTTAEISKSYVRVRADGKGKEYKYRVPVPKPLVYNHKNLFSPYVLGVWLGDGSRNDNRIATSKEDLPTLLRELQKENIEVQSAKSWCGKYEVRIGTTISHDNSVRSALRNLGVWNNKHVPEEYLTASVEQRLDLLRGLMDTDGTCTKSGECVFTQKSKAVTDGVSKLLTSLCIKHSVIERKATCNGVDCGTVYGITFYVDKDNTCFRYQRKTDRLKNELAKRMEYKSIVNVERVANRDTKCISVDSKRNLFVCGNRNTLTHNSETSSAICDTEMCIGGEGMDIVCASNTYDQSDILYEACDTMRQLIDPNNKDTWRNIKGLRCMYNNNRITKMSDRTKGKEGKNIDIAVVDECHEMADNTLVKPIEQSMSVKEEKKLILITTEGFTNGGYLDGLLKEYRAIISGEDTSYKSKRRLPWLYTQDSEAEVWNTDEDGINIAWQKSNPTLIYGVKKWSYLRDQVDSARRSKADRAYVLSKDFNFKVNNSSAWLDRSDYDYISEFELDDFRGSYFIGAVDLSETTDMTSAKILLCKKDDRRKYVVSHYWIPESKLVESDDKESQAKYEEWARAGHITICDGNAIKLELVADWFWEIHEKYNLTLLYCGYDQRFKTDWVNRMEYYGWNDKQELIMINQSADVLHTANRQVENDLRDKLICGLNDVDRWCLGNAALKLDGKGKSLVVKQQTTGRIDGAVCLVILFETYSRYRTELNDYL